MSKQNISATNSSCVLYLGAIPYNWDVEIIKSVVCGSGPVVDVRCMMDNASKNKGFCFVEYSNPEAAQRALTILGKIKIEGRKKLRIELSKEGLRNPVPGTKPELQINRNFLPSNVILPPEMNGQAKSHSNSYNSGNSTETIMAAISSNPRLQQIVSKMIADGMDINQIAQVIQQLINPNGRQQQTPTPPPVPLHQQHPSTVLPNNLTMASQFLPFPNQLNRSIYAKDKVSEILSSIPPGVLIELLSKLKLILSQPQPNYIEATTILNENPKLAIAAAQSLLLMGIIDLDVINSATQQAAANTSTNSNANINNSSISSSSSNNTQNLINPTTGLSLSHQRHPSSGMQIQQQQQQQQYYNSPAPSNSQQQSRSVSPIDQQQISPDWMMFGQSTIQKLLLLKNKNEADLIIQVLKLSPQQIDLLPENEKVMANSIRAQYL